MAKENREAKHTLGHKHATPKTEKKGEWQERIQQDNEEAQAMLPFAWRALLCLLSLYRMLQDREKKTELII